MKIIWISLSIMVFFLCCQEKDVNENGPAIIKGEKKFTFSSKATALDIETLHPHWWFAEIKVHTKSDSCFREALETKDSVVYDWLKITRREEIIQVKIAENTNKLIRSFHLTVQAGNRFERLCFEQKPE